MLLSASLLQQTNKKSFPGMELEPVDACGSPREGWKFAERVHQILERKKTNSHTHRSVLVRAPCPGEERRKNGVESVHPKSIICDHLYGNFIREVHKSWRASFTSFRGRGLILFFALIDMHESFQPEPPLRLVVLLLPGGLEGILTSMH